ncbi:MAG: winged helix-turn-helix domain-containing protein [Alteromonadaceae bacterium]|nr:winged helix-turn-helix domain-containing protein [Alteromonadaceae bacterium]
MMMQFGEFTLDDKQARLLCQEKEIAIEPKLFELLLLFVNQPNTIISRQDILDNLWRGSLVTDNAINKLVANLRKVLGDGAKNPRYIQTVPKRGYRLICKVTLLETLNAKEKGQFISDVYSETISRKKSLQNRSNSKAIIALLLLICSLFLWQVFSNNDKNSNSNRYTMELTRAHGAEESARMHPDNNHLYYLKKDLNKTSENTNYQLWIKNIHTAKIKQVDIAKTSISKIIAVVTGSNSNTTNLFYLDKKQDSCGVYQATLKQINHVKQASEANKTMQWRQAEKLFDCSDKRIKDIDYHVSKNMIYYTAQPRNFWPNQVYAFNLATKKHSFVTQTEPVGWGHHSIDISPDGNKLLIMSTNSDYKTQLLVLNLLNNEITEGFKFDYPVSEAIWHHDSEQVYYYAAPPAHQIIKSDLNGNNATTVVSVSEYLSPHMSLFPDGKNLLFSTEQKNSSNRWLVPPKQVSDIDNSTVDDINPALFHHSSQYLFISKRSGRRQLYLGRYDAKQADIVTNFSQSHWLGYIAVSADDQSVLVNADNEVYLLPISTLNEISPLTILKQEYLIFTSEHPIISLDWLTKNGVAITTVINGIPELMVVDLFNNKVQQINGKWAYGLTDRQHPEYNYLIEQQSNTLYRTNSLTFSDDLVINQHEFTKTQVTLPNGFFHVKIDANVLYYGSDESDSNYLNAVPINNIDKGSKYPLNDFSGYDVSNGKIIVSDIESLEGDVHRTMH